MLESKLHTKHLLWVWQHNQSQAFSKFLLIHVWLSTLENFWTWTPFLLTTYSGKLILVSPMQMPFCYNTSGEQFAQYLQYYYQSLPQSHFHGHGVVILSPHWCFFRNVPHYHIPNFGTMSIMDIDTGDHTKSAISSVYMTFVQDVWLSQDELCPWIGHLYVYFIVYISLLNVCTLYFNNNYILSRKTNKINVM